MGRRSRRGRNVSGVLLLDKPAGVTSNGALQRVKRLFDAAKAGHAGSLDPLATGMLPLCFGSATKISGFVLDAAKTYRVTARAGQATDSGDADGEVVETVAPPALDAARLGSVLETFRGEQTQVPPMHSALKRDGRRLYELAREGRVVEREARAIVIHAIELERVEGSDFEFRVECSKGTYVRSLVVDIAARLGTLAHVTALRRLAVEPFAESQMVDEPALERAAAAGGPKALDALLLPADSALAGLPRLELDAQRAAELLHGRRVRAETAWPRGSVRLYGPDARFLGVGEVLDDREVAPRRLFAA